MFHRVLWETGERTGAMLRLRWEWLYRGGLDVPGEARKGGLKRAFYSLSEPTLIGLDAIRHPTRDLIFELGTHRSTFYSRYTRILKRAGLPTDRKCKPQRMRRTHLTYWQIGGGDATARAQHSDRATTARHYIDETLLGSSNPDDFLPVL